MGIALHHISSKAALGTAWAQLWRRVRPRSRGNHGVDGVSLYDFDATAKSRLHVISREIRNGTYNPSQLRPDFIDKGGGKLRVICVPTTTDRIVQSSILNYLQHRYHARFSNPISYGFIKDRTVKTALQVAASHRAKHQWVFKTDISSFFDRIPRDILQTRIKKLIREKTLHPILCQIVHCEIYADSKTTAKKIAKQGIKSGIGVRQGMPLSPFFSNLLLDRFDKAVLEAGLHAVRYADDLIFFADSKEQCEEIASFCATELNEDKLKIPPLGLVSKTQIYAPEQEAEFLGAALTRKDGAYHITVPKARIDKIVKSFLDLSNIKELVSRKIDIAKLRHILSAKRAGYDHAYNMCENVDQLYDKLVSIEQKVLRKIYTEQLKINLSALPAVAHRFLGLH